MIQQVKLYGNSGLMCDFGNEVTHQTNNAVLFVSKQVQQFTGVLYTVPTYNKLVVYYDNTLVDTGFLIEQIESIIIPEEFSAGTKWHIPVCYSADCALDLKKISDYVGLTEEQVIDSHTSKPLYMYGYGFLPGMPKYGDTELCAPRRLDKPRRNVLAGSIGWVEHYGSVYTQDTIGGWNIIGRSPIKFFNAQKQDPCLIKPGDWIQFYSITAEEFYDWH